MASQLVRERCRGCGRRSAVFVLAGLCAATIGCNDLAPEPFVQEGPGFYQELTWSPDGAALLVSVLEVAVAEPGYAYRIWQLDPEGTRTPTPLTSGPRDYWTSFSPDGGRIVFAAPTDSGSLDIFVMAADGSGRERITSDAADDTQPAWSPDGTRIAFVSHRGGHGELWVMDLDGSGAQRLVASEQEAQSPAWSPDGSRIAYYETDGQGTDYVMVVRADGSEPRRLTEGLWPTWTPDGRSLVFSGEDGLYRMSGDGGTPELVLSGKVIAGELSPDGGRLAAIVQDSAAISVVVGDARGRHAITLMKRPPPPW